MSLSHGQRIGPYEIVSPLGAGGMGDVYRAHDARLGREVALKVLPLEVATDPERLARFNREARAVAALNHPHIVTIFSFEEDNGVPFITMELVEGRTLDHELAQGGLPVARLFDIGIAIADALAATHRKGIVHRDLKPANVMVSRDGVVKMLDFGLARDASTHQGSESDVTSLGLTKVGVIVGTVPYMSPEQIEAKTVDHRSDIFSYGVVLYEMATGTRPFSGGSAPALISSILRDRPLPIAATRADVPEGVWRLVTRCLEKSPGDRVQSAQEIHAELKALRRAWESAAIAPTAKIAAAVDGPPKSRVQRVTTTTAATFWPSLSSDGRLVVYVSDAGQDGATPQVWVQQVGGAAVQITAGMRDCADPAFSHDDTRVIFSAAADSSRHVYEVPTFGGPSRVLKRMARGARFAPDGKWLVYLAIDSADAVRMVSATGEERLLATGLIDVAFAIWADNGQHLLVVGHPKPSADRDCWIVPVDGGAAVDTGVLRRARQQGMIVISMAVAWTGDSIFFTAAGRHGVQVWRQRVSLTTFEAIGSPELMTPGADSAFFPTAARGRLGFVGVHTDTNMWSVAIDVQTGIARGQPRRLTRGGGFVNSFSVSRDGNTLAYFAAGSSGVELRVRDVQRGTEAVLEGVAADNRGFPVISLDGKRLAFGTMVAGPPVKRPLFVANLADGASRLVFDDCGGRPRLWIDDERLLAETFGAGLNSFIVLDTREATQRPLLSSREHRLSNPRLSPDAQWLAFDATPPGGSPSVLVARLDDGHAADETAWIRVEAEASHPFWSQDGRLLYYLPAIPTVDIRNRVVARAFEPSDGSIGTERVDVLALSEMIVPAMISTVAPIVAGDQIVFLLGNYRGDIWIMDV